MKVRVLTLRLDPATGAFDDSALVELLSETEALDVSDHLFVHEGVPTLTLVVRYRAPRPPPGGRPASPRRSAAPAAPAAPAADLAEEDRPLFETLRRWRNDRARRDGRPAYVLLTNNQLVAIATRRPTSRADLQDIPGVGQGRVDNYGHDVLAIVQRFVADAAPPATSASTPPAPQEPADEPPADADRAG